MKKKNIYGIIVVALVCIGIILGGKDIVDKSNSNNYQNTNVDESNVSLEGDILEVHFIDVGQGDSTLIIQGENSMLIDAGTNESAEAVTKFSNVLVVDVTFGNKILSSSNFSITSSSPPMWSSCGCVPTI